MTTTVERATATPARVRPVRCPPAAGRTRVSYDLVSGLPCLHITDPDGTVHWHEMTREQLDDLADQIAALDGDPDCACGDGRACRCKAGMVEPNRGER